MKNEMFLLRHVKFSLHDGLRILYFTLTFTIRFADGIPACRTDGTSRNAQVSSKNIYRRIIRRRAGLL